MTDPVSHIEFDAPIIRESVAEMVVRRILGMVKSGALKAGAALPPERDMAVMLTVSRPSVREAIRALSVLGVVRTRQGGGAFITDLGPDMLLGPIQFYLSLQIAHVPDLYDARSLIESDVARRAAVNMSDADLTRLEAVLAAQAATVGDPLAFRKSDFEFHELIWIGSGNAFLKRIGESLNVIGLEFRKRASEKPLVLQQSLMDHARIVQALKARDAEAAARAAETHMRNVFQSTITQGE